MNIFWLDNDMQKNVSYYIDKHVVKMITEHAQLLSSAVRLSGLDAGYKLSHAKHPCAIWARESLSNWLYLRDLTIKLHNEYRHRYGMHKRHSAYLMVLSLPYPNIEDKGLTEPPQCMPEKYKCDNYIVAYRNYYIGEKRSFASWRYRPLPYWYNLDGELLPLTAEPTLKIGVKYEGMNSILKQALIENVYDKMPLGKVYERIYTYPKLNKYILELGLTARIRPTIIYLLMENLSGIKVLSAVELTHLYKIKQLINKDTYEKCLDSIFSSSDTGCWIVIAEALSTCGVEFDDRIERMYELPHLAQFINNRDFLPITYSVYMNRSNHNVDPLKGMLKMY